MRKEAICNPSVAQKHGTCTHTHLLSFSVTRCHCTSCGLLVVCSGMPNTTTNGPDALPGDIKLSTLVPVLAGPLSSLQICLPENFFFFFFCLCCASLYFSPFIPHTMCPGMWRAASLLEALKLQQPGQTSSVNVLIYLSSPANLPQPGRGNELGSVLIRWRGRVEKTMMRGEEPKSQVGGESEVSWCEHEVAD